MHALFVILVLITIPALSFGEPPVGGRLVFPDLIERATQIVEKNDRKSVLPPYNVVASVFQEMRSYISANGLTASQTDLLVDFYIERLAPIREPEIRTQFKGGGGQDVYMTIQIVSAVPTIRKEGIKTIHLLLLQDPEVIEKLTAKARAATQSKYPGMSKGYVSNAEALLNAVMDIDIRPYFESIGMELIQPRMSEAALRTLLDAAHALGPYAAGRIYEFNEAKFFEEAAIKAINQQRLPSAKSCSSLFAVGAI